MRGRTTALPASSGQQRLWFHDQLAPGTPAYNVHLGTDLHGRLDVPALGAALDDVVARHEALRTTLRAVDGTPRQVVAARITVPTTVHDLRGIAAGQRDGEVARRASEHAATVFDLAIGPLLRSDMLCLSDDRHLWLLTLHHAVCDGHSAGLLFSEVSAAYRARVEQRPLALPPLALQYADYAIWQHDELEAGGFDADIAHWRDHLGQAPDLLPLPPDRPRPTTRSFEGALLDADLSVDEVASVDEIARPRRATRFQVMLAVLAAVLHRMTGERDVVVGTAVDVRDHPELEPLIGFFVNTVPLRLRVSPDTAFGELVDQARDVALDAQSHAQVPFELLVRELCPQRPGTHHPLFQVMLDVQPGRADALRLPGVTACARPAVDRATSLFDIGLSLNDGAHGIGLVVEYATGLFTTATAATVLDALRAVIRTARAHPRCRVAELPLLDGRQAACVVASADRSDEAVHAEDVVTTIRRRARRNPMATAIVDAATGASIDRARLTAWSAAIAADLRAVGVGRGDHVVLLVERCPAAIAAQLGILAAGAAFVPVDPAAPDVRRRQLLDAVDPAAVLVGPRVASPTGQWPVLVLDASPPAGDAVADDRCEVTPLDAAYVLHTSGSTGTPKGVVVVHGGVANYAAADRDAFHLTSSDRVLQFTALTYDVSAEEIWPCLTAGAALVLRSAAMLDTPRDFLDGCERLGITVAHLPTSWFHELVADVQRGAARVPDCLRTVVIGGEPALPGRVDAWHAAAPHAAVTNVYGPTEATIATTLERLTGPPRDDACWRVPIGRSLPGTAVHVLDATLRPVPAGVVGEIHIGGVGLARGYLDRPDLTAERFVPDPARPGARLYRTGDLGRRLADGRLLFCGRGDRQVKVRGHRVEPGEVEDRIADLPGVRHALVQARQLDDAASELVAFVETDSTDVAALRRGLAAVLPASLVPTRWVRVERMPWTTAGKVDVSALPDPPSASGVEAGGGGALLAGMEARVGEVWREVLGVAPIGREDDFFAVGGHSLLATRVIARLRRLGVHAEVRHVFAHPRLADFAAAVGPVVPDTTGCAAPTLRRVTESEMRASVAASLAGTAVVDHRLDTDRQEP